MMQQSNQHYPNYQGNMMYQCPPMIRSIFDYQDLRQMMYGMYNNRTEDASVLLKPMLLEQGENKFNMLIGQ